MPEPTHREVSDEPPPFLKTWKEVYFAVICYLTVLIVLFYWFAQAFAA